MKTALKLQATPRTVTGKKVSELRKNGEIPAVMYGKGLDAKPLTISYSVFERAYRQAGESSLLDLVIDNEAPVKVLVQEVQHDALTQRITHADFYQVRMTEKLTANIPLNFIGEAKAVKEMGGTLVRNISEIEVRCLPDALVHEIDVDISSLSSFEALIRVSDLNLPAGMEVLIDATRIIANVASPISEEELKALDEKPVEDVSNVAVEEKGKKEKEA